MSNGQYKTWSDVENIRQLTWFPEVHRRPFKSVTMLQRVKSRKKGVRNVVYPNSMEKKQFLQSGDIVYISNIYISRTQDLLNETQINALLMMHKTMST